MALAHTMKGIPVDKVSGFVDGLIEMFETEHQDICSRIDSTGMLDDELKEEIISISAAYREKFNQ
jgi:F0F1-type ATP synthase alpha subunit